MKPMAVITMVIVVTMTIPAIHIPFLLMVRYNTTILIPQQVIRIGELQVITSLPLLPTEN